MVETLQKPFEYQIEVNVLCKSICLRIVMSAPDTFQ